MNRLPLLVHTALIIGLAGALCAPVMAQTGLGDMRDPYSVAERAAACVRALREGGKGPDDPSVKRWHKALRFAGAWSAQYGYSLRAIHLVEGAKDSGCEADLETLGAQFDKVINETYMRQWKAAQTVITTKKPVLDQGVAKRLSQAAWCVDALMSGKTAIEKSPGQFGFSMDSEQGKQIFHRTLIRYALDAQSWQNYTTQLTPHGSYSALSANQARAAFAQWESELASSSERSFWLSFLANEVSACDALTPAVESLMAPFEDDFE